MLSSSSSSNPSQKYFAGNLQYWLGISDIPVENRWEFASDGEEVTNGFRGQSEPNGNLNENCVVAELADGRHGAWADYSCKTNRHFICEKPER